jgi:L-cysteine:1D-myo-inositol 2-amino-2-deoxy-alpha-D-glucopyranoside ligase
VLQRYFRYLGYNVTYVQNVTDIDDDILKRANKLDQDWKELGKFWTETFLRDTKTLGIELPTHYVKATEAIPEIIVIIRTLLEKGFAYEKGGNIYFDTAKDKEYGKLSQYSRAKMIKLSKERGANPSDPLKKHALDFILWQTSTPKEPYWESPWGKGRPGWHIECSAMIYKYLYNNIDIHGGGTDLIYPHHESEIAQSEQFTNVQPLAKYWMHTGAVGYQGEKMSKSLGNLVLISTLLKTYSPQTIRYLLLSHHYRKPWEFTEDQLTSATEKATALKTLLRDQTQNNTDNNELMQEFSNAMENDLDTPQALHVLEKAISKKEYISVKKMADILGFTF